MINLSVRLSDLGLSTTAASAISKASSISSQSFAEQLSEAFAETLSKLGIDPNSVKLTVDGSSSQANVTRQNPAAQDSSGSAAAPVSGFSALVPLSADPIAVPASSTPSTAPQSADDIYWSKQPDAVQKLRTIDDQSQRSLLAAQLAADGYAIDVPVMVWGWDPGKTTELRHGFGYTWIPSAMQPQVNAAPGISGGAIVPYDPAHPPVGSILV